MIFPDFAYTQVGVFAKSGVDRMQHGRATPRWGKTLRKSSRQDRRNTCEDELLWTRSSWVH